MNKDTLYVKRKRPTDMLLLAAIYVSATLAVALLLGIILYVFVKGIRTVNWAFLTTVTSARKQTTGIAGNLLNTLYIIVITLLIATPIGVGSAIYLNEYAKPGKLVSIIEFTTETLSGIPSIIFGLFGMIFFGETLGFGYSLLTGSFTLTLMVLPLITRNTQEALRTVPDSYRTGASGNGIHEMAYDPDDPSAVFHARYRHRYHSGTGTYRGRVCGSVVHCGKRLQAAEVHRSFRRQSGKAGSQGHGVWWYSDHRIVFTDAEGTV